MYQPNYVLLCIGGLFLIASFLLFLWNLLFLLRSETTEGEIIGDDREENNEGTIARTMVEFKTKDGQTIQFTDSALVDDSFAIMGILYSLLVKGKNYNKVMVVYDPNNPKRARIKNFLFFYFWPMVIGLIGLAICVGGVFPTDKVKEILHSFGL
jgi:hypothetical protein